jgi:hypothetical protein
MSVSTVPFKILSVVTGDNCEADQELDLWQKLIVPAYCEKLQGDRVNVPMPYRGGKDIIKRCAACCTGLAFVLPGGWIYDNETVEERTEHGEMYLLWGFYHPDTGHRVMSINEYLYDNVRGLDYCLFADDREALEHFVRDFNVQGEIQENMPVVNFS